MGLLHSWGPCVFFTRWVFCEREADVASLALITSAMLRYGGVSEVVCNALPQKSAHGRGPYSCLCIHQVEVRFMSAACVG